MNLNVRAYILVIVFSVLLALVFAIGIQQGWGAFRKPTKEQVLNPTAANLAALEPGQVDMAAIDLIMALIPPSSSDEIRQLNVKLTGMTYYVRDDNPDVDVAQVCVGGVDVFINPSDEANSLLHSFIAEPVCETPTPDDFTAEATDFEGFTLDNYYQLGVDTPDALTLEVSDPDIISLNFWYPYDSFTIHAGMLVYYSVELSDSSVVASTITPYMFWDIQTSGTRLWDVQLASQTQPLSDLDPSFTVGSYENLTMTFNRSLLYRILFPFFIVAMVLLIGLMPLLGDRDAFVEISAGMLFGIFGLKGILGPGEQMGQTVLDIALIGLYVVLAFAGLLFFANKISLRRRPQQTTQE